MGSTLSVRCIPTELRESYSSHPLCPLVLELANDPILRFDVESDIDARVRHRAAHRALVTDGVCLRQLPLLAAFLQARPIFSAMHYEIVQRSVGTLDAATAVEVDLTLLWQLLPDSDNHTLPCPFELQRLVLWVLSSTTENVQYD
ncbi:hypothetical protein CCICO_09760 [Corynebacterium ciconiae DSM 44920]|uniref:hypothetical protein n=1 Tax=Corynebacterium ciconiae TaxID=227319 RepID=UPI0003757190|nr:hypothetical protein [Corynebacterium ciconiae]WKD61951.1 hypothetical protein CCICO_09760 [Corynebacterium ciconiae DSM 44920]